MTKVVLAWVPTLMTGLILVLTAAGVGHLNKRTHTLSNGAVIWDFAGNVWQWVRDDNDVSQGTQEIGGFIQAATYNDALKWGPAGDYSAQTGSRRAGLGHGWSSDPAAAVIRGGVWNDGAGPFSLFLVLGPSGESPSIGFRCVFAP